MFDNFPKTRSNLPKRYIDIYNEHYHDNRIGKGGATKYSNMMERWLHRKVANNSECKPNSILEIGAGTLNQLDYEVSFQNYDIVEPFKLLYEKSNNINKINNIYDDIQDIENSKKYNKISSIATFEHILDLPKVVALTCLHLEKGGSLLTAIPNEGSWLWKLAYSLTTGIEFRFKYGLDYSVLMNYEHVNNADEIEEILTYFYDENNCNVFGINKNISLYRFYNSQKPNISRAKEYLEQI